MPAWWVFPVVWGLSSGTLSTGIGAGVVYAPLFTLALGFDLQTAVGTSILTQVAGVGTTAFGHLREGDTDRPLAARLGTTAVVGVILGWAVVDVIPRIGAEILFVVGMTSIGLWLVAGRRTRLPLPVTSQPAVRAVFHRGAQTSYEFCRPDQGYVFAVLAGSGTAVLGISGAEVQISALMLRCRVPTLIAIGTGTAAAALALVAASGVAVITGNVAWTVAIVSMPAAVLGSLTSRVFAHRLVEEGLRVGVGLLLTASGLGVGIREILL